MDSFLLGEGFLLEKGTVHRQEPLKGSLPWKMLQEEVLGVPETEPEGKGRG